MCCQVHLQWNELATPPRTVYSKFEVLDSGEGELAYRYLPEWNARVPEAAASAGDMVLGSGHCEMDDEYGVNFTQVGSDGYWLPLTTLQGKVLIQQLDTVEVDHSTMSASELKLFRRCSPLPYAEINNHSLSKEGILSVQLCRAEQLRFNSKKEPKVSAVLAVGAQYQQTAATRSEEGDADWNELFFFAVEDYVGASLNIALIVDDNDDDRVGHLSMPIADVVSHGGAVEKRWSLNDCEGALFMSCVWKSH